MTPNIIVRNNGEKPFCKAWDSIEYEFPPGQEVTIPLPAAQYLFGFGLGESVRTACLLRNGWLQRTSINNAETRAKAAAMLDSFSFKQIEMGGKKVSKQKDPPAYQPSTLPRTTDLKLPLKHDNVSTRRQPPA